MPDIDSLSIQISTSAQSAVSGVDSLTQSLTRLRSAVRSAARVNTLGERLKGIGDSAQTLDTSAIGKLRSLANGIKSLTNVRISSTIAKELLNIGAAAEILQGADLSGINNVADALRQFADMGHVRIRLPQINETANDASAAASAVSDLSDAEGELSGQMTDTARVTSIASGGMRAFRDRLLSALGSVRSFGRTVATEMGGSLRRSVSTVNTFAESLRRIAYYRFIRTIIKEIAQSFREGMTNLYNYSRAMGGDFAKSMDMLATSSQYLKNSLAAMVSPLVNALAPAIDFVIDKIVVLMNYINQFIAALSGAQTYTVAKKVAAVWSDTASKTAGSAKKTADEIKRTILGFDEINKLVKENARGSGGGSGSGSSAPGGGIMFEELPINSFGNAVQKAMSNTLSKIGMIVAGAALAVGALLTLSGANVPLGLSLMVAGASGLVSIIGMNWSELPDKVKAKIGIVEGIAAAALLGIGAILAFSGVKVPLGIAMMAAGAATGIAAIGLNWGMIKAMITRALSNTTAVLVASSSLLAVGMILALSGVALPIGLAMAAVGAAGIGYTVTQNWGMIKAKISRALNDTYNVLLASVALLGIGAVLAFSGVSLPIGIAMIAAGAAGLGYTISQNWGMISAKVQRALGSLGGFLAVSTAALALGAVLTFSGVALPIGLALMALGATGLVTAVSENWGMIKAKIERALSNVTNVLLLSTSALALGALLTFSGINIPIGLALMALGAAGVVKVASDNWGTITAKVQRALGNLNLKLIASTAFLAIGAILAFSGVGLPLGIALMAAGAVGLVKEVTANWGVLSDKLKGPLSVITTLLEGAELALGILACVGGNIPLGLGLIISGAGGLAKKISAHWDDIVGIGKKAIEKLKEGWDTAKDFLINIVVKIGGALWDGVTSFWDWLWNPHQAGGDLNKMAEFDINADVNLTGGKGINPNTASDPSMWTLDSSVQRGIEKQPLKMPVEAKPAWTNLVNYLHLDKVSTNIGIGLNKAWQGSVTRVLGLENLSTNVTVGVTAKKGSGVQLVGAGGSKAWVLQAKALGGVLLNNLWHSLPQFANGAFGIHGTLFAAGENGAEVVGNVGNRTEVLNKSQIASAMFSAVRSAMAPASANFATAASKMGGGEYEDENFDALVDFVRQGSEATLRQNELLRQQNELLRQINDKEFSMDISTGDLQRAQYRANRRAGVTVIPVGT